MFLIPLRFWGLRRRNPPSRAGGREILIGIAIAIGRRQLKTDGQLRLRERSRFRCRELRLFEQSGRVEANPDRLPRQLILPIGASNLVESVEQSI
jgi:hypothetical protein